VTRDAAWAAFPRQHARTRRFSLGEPRAFTVAPGGERVAFLRSDAGDDPVHALWCLDLPDGTERRVIDPRTLDADDADLPAEERARRERARESGAGIVAYTCDDAVTTAAFTIGGRLFVVDLTAASPSPGAAITVEVRGPVVAPVLSPTGAAVAFVRDGAIHVVDLADGRETTLAGEDDPDITWGLPDFVAAEEMGRMRGLWWSPDGTRILAARVDVGSVERWHIADPSAPATAPAVIRYPAAGTHNAVVTLAIIDRAGNRTDVDWDHRTRPYLASARWSDEGAVLAVQSRDQRELDVLALDPASGATRRIGGAHDERWVDLVGGSPRLLDGGRLLTTIDDDEADTRRLAVDGRALTPPGLQVRRIAGVVDGAALVTASGADPTAVAVWRVPLDGSDPGCLTEDPGVHDVVAAGEVTVLTRRALDLDGSDVEVRHPGGVAPIAAHGEPAHLTPEPELLALGDRDLRAALLLPRGHGPDDEPLPVLLDPYGGPHAQRVLRARGAFGTSQWFADAGYAVLVVDGRGSPGRGPRWERAIAGDLASAPLEDQLAALRALASQRPGLLDLDRVGIRGWSFGGYLAALAVLRRPDAVHVGIAGAPVTDWRLYDTHYTERYLGDPRAEPAAYAGSSLLDDAAARPFPDLPDRALLLIHGLADDNVVAAHTLRLSQALLEAGRPHRVLPLLGVTHMTPQEVVAENLLLLQLDLLDEQLCPSSRRR
jgi:dipeptidyl-peptidase 4